MPEILQLMLSAYQRVYKEMSSILADQERPSYMSPDVGGRGICGVSAVLITWHGAQINFGDLTPYLTNGDYHKIIKRKNGK